MFVCSLLFILLLRGFPDSVGLCKPVMLFGLSSSKLEQPFRMVIVQIIHFPCLLFCSHPQFCILKSTYLCAHSINDCFFDRYHFPRTAEDFSTIYLEIYISNILHVGVPSIFNIFYPVILNQCPC